MNETLPATTADTSRLRPVFIRLPKSGHLCPFTGLSRTTLSRLVLPGDSNDNSPPVRSYSLCGQGRGRGVRLIEFESLVSYVRGRR